MTGGAESGGGLVFLDACCLINLFGSGRVEEILAGLPYRFAVARYVVEQEVLEIAVEGAGEDPKSGEKRVALRPGIDDLIAGGVLEQVDLTTSEEVVELVRFARELDDGEAHTAALAILRGARVATDDRKAIRILRSAWREREVPVEPILRTSELIFPWAEVNGVGEVELTRIFRAVARRATFFPPRDDPWWGRWMGLLQGEG